MKKTDTCLIATFMPAKCNYFTSYLHILESVLVYHGLKITMKTFNKCVMYSPSGCGSIHLT